MASERALRLGAALLLLVALAAPAAAAVEQDPGADLIGLQVVTGYGAPATPARWLPVQVTLEPLRPLAGTVEVEVLGAAGGRTTYAREVEVAAGARSDFRFVVPVGSVIATFREPGAEPVAVRIRQEQPGDGFLLGALGEVPSGAPPVRHEASGRTGAWVEVDPAWLSVGAAALEPLGGLVAGAGALEALDEPARRNLAAAVVAGTDLLVVADQPGPVDLAALGLPAGPGVDAAPAPGSELLGLTVSGPAWTLSAADVGAGGDAAVAVVAEAGRGRVAVVGVAPGAGAVGGSSALWSALAGPPAGVQPASEWDLARAPYQFSRLLADEDAGVPAVPWLASFLVAYILVVGPVNGLVLARLRRVELAWLTVPVVTAVFTAAAFLGAVGGRPPLGVAARLTSWVDGVGTETAVAGVRNPTPGVREAVLPGAGWLVQTLGAGTRGATVRAGADVAAELDLGALQLGGLVASRPLPGDPPLDVEAMVFADRVEVVVRNTGTAPLDGVVVRAATSSRPVGALAPGAERGVTIEASRLRAADPHGDLLAGIATQAGGGAEPPRSLEALLRADLMDGSPGLVWALGQQDHSAPEVRAGGEQAVDAGTLVAVGVQPTLPPDGAVGPLAVGRSLVSASSQSYRPTPLSVEGSNEVVLRYRFPSGGRTERLYSDLERGTGDQATLSLWDVGARQWVPLGQAFAVGADSARFLSPLGEVHVRSEGFPGIFDFSSRAMAGVPMGQR